MLVGIAASDHSAYLYQDAAWTPAREKERSGFDPGLPAGEGLTTLYALIHWTTGGSMSFLA